MKKPLRWLAPILLMAGSALQAATLESVREHGALRCGVNGSIPGLSHRSEGGVWSGLDVDFCRAVAAAVLGDADKVEFTPLSTKERLNALAQGRIDVLARNTTWTLHRELSHGVDFVGINYYDGQAFMVPREAGLHSALELGGTTLCTLADSTSVRHAEQYFRLNRMKHRLLTFDSVEAARTAYLAGECDALTSDQSQLYALRFTFEDPKAHRILPELISKEPLGPAVAGGDDAWFDIVQWTLFAQIDAEEMEIDSSNVDRIKDQAQSDAVRYLLGLEGDSGKALGLDPDWAYQIIKQVGNYGETFERNLGKQSPLKIKRGLNALWRDGGLMYAPPVR